MAETLGTDPEVSAVDLAMLGRWLFGGAAAASLSEFCSH